MSLQEVADRTGCTVRFLVAVRAVESGGNPAAVRFEPHLFKRIRPDLVLDIPRSTRSVVAVRMRGEAWASGKVPYTPGTTRDGKPRSASSSTAETNREAFESARKLDAGAAVVSSSWGSYQQLGGAFKRALGLDAAKNANDANAAVAAFDADPLGVSNKLLAAWLLSNPKALQAARDGNIEEFVRRYNGGVNPGYCAKMRAALVQFDAGKLRP